MSISINNISKSFAGQKALNTFNSEFEKSKTSVLIGPSGCGKSTLLRIIVGLIKADTGEITIGNMQPSESNIYSLRRNIGYVIQEGGLFPHLTAKENISLMASYIGWSREKISDKIGELIFLTKFPSDGLDRYPAELSGGQKQRVSLMRALILDPEFLLLDEPLGALDPLIRFDLQTDLKEIFESLHKTVIMVTHDLNEAIFFADKIFLVKDGNIVQSGRLEDFINFPSDPFVTRFINAQRTELTVNGGN